MSARLNLPTYPYLLYRGDTFRRVINVQQGPSGGPYTDYSFAGATALCHIRIQGGERLIKTLTTEDGSIILQTGKIYLFLSAVDAAAIQAGNYRYDIQVTLASGDVVTFVRGLFIVVGDSTYTGSQSGYGGVAPGESSGVSDDVTLILYTDPELTLIFSEGIPGPTGAAPVIAEQTILEGGSVVIPAGKSFTGLGVRSAVGARTLNLGTTVGGTDLLEVQDLRAGINERINVSKYFPDGGTLYFSGAGTIIARVYTE